MQKNKIRLSRSTTRIKRDLNNSNRIIPLVNMELTKSSPNTEALRRIIEKSTQLQGLDIPVRHAIAQYLSNNNINMEQRARVFIKLASVPGAFMSENARFSNKYILRFISDLVGNYVFTQKFLPRPELVREIIDIICHSHNCPVSELRTAATDLLQALETFAKTCYHLDVVSNADFIDNYTLLLRGIRTQLPDLWNDIIEDNSFKSFACTAGIFANKVETADTNTLDTNEILDTIYKMFNHKSATFVDAIVATIYMINKVAPLVAKNNEETKNIIKKVLYSIYLYSERKYNCPDSIWDLYVSTLVNLIKNSEDKRNVVHFLLQECPRMNFTDRRFFRWNACFIRLIKVALVKACDDDVLAGIVDYLLDSANKDKKTLPPRFIKMPFDVLARKYEHKYSWKYVIALCKDKKEKLFELLEHRTDIDSIHTLCRFIGLLLSIDYDRAVQGPVAALLKKAFKNKQDINQDVLLAIFTGLLFCDTKSIVPAMRRITKAISQYNADKQIIQQVIEKTSEIAIFICNNMTKTIKNRINIINNELENMLLEDC